jgi:hypothetical protein
MQEPLAMSSNTTWSPRRLIATRCSTFTGVFAWHSDERNALKSCSPSSVPAAARMAATSSGRWNQPTRPANTAGRTGWL